jgi:hypothetical protein
MVGNPETEPQRNNENSSLFSHETFFPGTGLKINGEYSVESGGLYSVAALELPGFRAKP